MTQHEFRASLREGTATMGFKRGTRVQVKGTEQTGIVVAKLVRGPNKVRQSIKFDDNSCGVFDHTDLIEAAPIEGKPTEVDMLGERIRRT